MGYFVQGKLYFYTNNTLVISKSMNDADKEIQPKHCLQAYKCVLFAFSLFL